MDRNVDAQGFPGPRPGVFLFLVRFVLAGGFLVVLFFVFFLCFLFGLSSVSSLRPLPPPFRRRFRPHRTSFPAGHGRPHA
jgi:hypothetical protein